jgi:hypothetical protein
MVAVKPMMTTPPTASPNAHTGKLLEDAIAPVPCIERSVELLASGEDVGAMAAAAADVETMVVDDWVFVKDDVGSDEAETEMLQEVAASAESLGNGVCGKVSEATALGATLAQ